MSLSLCPVPPPTGQAERREGDLGGRGSLSSLPCDSTGLQRKAALLGRRAPRGPQFPWCLSAHPAGYLPGKGSVERVGDQEVATRLLGCQGPKVRLSVRASVCLFSRGTRPSPLVSGRNLGLRAARGLCVRTSLRLRVAFCVSAGGRRSGGTGGGVGEGVSASSPTLAPITRSLGLSLTHSDSGPVRDRAGASRRLCQTGASCPNGADPALDAAPGGRRAQAGARAEASSPEPVSRELEPRGARARRARLRGLSGVATAAMACRALAAGAAGG